MKKTTNWVFIPITLIAIIVIVFFINIYNTIQSKDEIQRAAAAEVINQYKRRSDLIGNLANTVKEYAKHEQSIFTEIASSRASLSQLKVNPDDLQNPATLKKYEDTQAKIQSQLSRLLVVIENYPDLKANDLFIDFMVQLEGTENRIAVARNRYIGAIREYNQAIRSFPYILMADALGYKPLLQFDISDKMIEETPSINF